MFRPFAVVCLEGIRINVVALSDEYTVGIVSFHIIGGVTVCDVWWACAHVWQDFVFSESCGSSPVLLILLSSDQWVIHPVGAEVMSADRWKLIFSFSIPIKSILNILPSDLPPSLSPNGLQCLHFVTSYRRTHTVCHGSLVCFSNFGLACQSPQVSRCQLGRCAGSTMSVWVAK